MARRRVYINPFDPSGTKYTGWIEVTNDVERGSIGTIAYKTDVSDYDVGVFTNAGVTLTLRNSGGKYSDVGNTFSIFQFRRSQSLVKITYDESDYDNFPGISDSDAILGQEILVFQGFLNDDSTTMQIKSALITFQVLGLESCLDIAMSPFALDTVPVAQPVSLFIEQLFNFANSQLPFPILTVNPAVILPGYDLIWDVNTPVPYNPSTFNSNVTCKDVLNQILTAANSVGLISAFDWTTPVVTPRLPSSQVLYSFYGPGSTKGPENIIDITDIRSGLNRTFNYVTFSNSANNTNVKSAFFQSLSTDAFAKNIQSFATYGARVKTLSVTGIKTVATQEQICSNILNEFAFPKQEFILTTTLNYAILQLPLLAMVSIDYPVVPIQNAPIPLPVYGKAVYGVDSYAAALNQFTIDPTDYYKVIGIEIDFINNTAKLNMREI